MAHHEVRQASSVSHGRWAWVVAALVAELSWPAASA